MPVERNEFAVFLILYGIGIAAGCAIATELGVHPIFGGVPVAVLMLVIWRWP
jgi:hypothetical protein